MARKESCAGTTLGTAVEDMCAFCEVPGRAALLVDLGDGRLRHACGGEDSQRTCQRATPTTSGRRGLFVFHSQALQSIAMRRPGGRDPSDCRGRDAPRDHDRNVQTLRRGFCRRASSPRNHDLEAAQPRPLLDRHTTLPMQLYLCSRSDVGAIADSLLWL